MVGVGAIGGTVASELARAGICRLDHDADPPTDPGHATREPCTRSART